MKNILRELMNEFEFNQVVLSNKTGIPQTTISNWFNKGQMPCAEHLVTLSKCFGVSTDFLLGLENDFGVNSYADDNLYNNLTNDELEILSMYRSLGELDKSKVKGFLLGIVDSYKQQQ